MPRWEVAPDDRLRPFVAHFAYSSDEGALPHAPIRIVPDGSTELLFSVDASSPRDGGPWRADLFGLKTRALLVEGGSGPVENVSVLFQPGGARHFFGPPAHETTDGALALRDLWKKADVEQVGDAVASRRTPLHRVGVLENALLERLVSLTTDEGYAREAIRWIQDASGNVSIPQLSEHLGLSERRLQRLFRNEIGTSPKRFARIVRFQHARRALSRGVPGAAVAADLGYFDQAHLLRDHREFAGIRPSRIVDVG